MKAVNLVTPEHEHEFEAVHGLPEALPTDETMLWQGSPDALLMARQALHLDLIGSYFAALVAWSGISAWYDGAALTQTLIIMGRATALFALAMGLLGVIGLLIARTSVYTITDRRVVMRIGVVLSITFNLPFKALASADVKSRKAGDGDIVLKIAGSDRIAWLHLWPHAQPWHMKTARPMLRAIAEPDYVAGVLADAVRAWAQAEAASVKVVPRAPHEPMLEIGIMAPARVQHELATEAGR